MPTVLHDGRYRFFFYAGDRGEPRHVHIESGEKTAKFWLEPVRFHRSSGFNRAEINNIQQLVLRHCSRLKRSWDEYFAG